MQSIKGIYKAGKIELLEEVNIENSCKVIVTFVEEQDKQDSEQIRENSADQDAFGFWNANEEDIYQDYLKK